MKDVYYALNEIDSMTKQEIEPQLENVLYDDLCHIIDGARARIATYLNTEVCMTNWYVGKRIKEDVLYNQRAEYGKQVLRNLSARLTESMVAAGDTINFNIVYELRTLFQKKRLCTQRVHN